MDNHFFLIPYLLFNESSYFLKKKGQYGCSSFIDYALDIDGAYFDTTFSYLFMMAYGHLKPNKAS